VVNSIWKWCKRSATIVVSRLIGLGSIAVGAVVWWATSDPTLHAAVTAVLSPKLVPFYGLGVAFVVEWARRRTL
jgi:hypothetical protein